VKPESLRREDELFGLFQVTPDPEHTHTHTAEGCRGHLKVSIRQTTTQVRFVGSPAVPMSQNTASKVALNTIFREHLDITSLSVLLNKLKTAFHSVVTEPTHLEHRTAQTA